MKRIVIAIALIVATQARAQDSSYSELRLRLSVLRNPVAGHINDDWRAGTGAQAEVGTPIAFGELALAVGHVGYTPTTGHPPYSATLFTLMWMFPETTISRLRLAGGARFTDYRMDFDDPAQVAGLRTEEELMIGVIGRARLPVANRFALFADGSIGMLMLATRTPMVLVHIGAERSIGTPGWLRGILR